MKTTLLFLLIILVCTGCSSSKKMQTNKHSIVGKYTETRYDYNTVIELKANGIFYLTYEKGQPPGLAKICECQQGKWYIKDDTIVLNTFFQNNIDNYFELEGYRNDDSIEVTMYSLNTMSITDEAICLAGFGFVYPDSNGIIVIPCFQKSQLATFIRAYIPIAQSFCSDEIVCGGKYKFFYKDCYPIVFTQRKFLIISSGILDLKFSTLYRHYNDNTLFKPKFGK